MKMFLITEGFPYGKGEKTFIKPELPYLKDKFDVTIVSCADYETKVDISNVTQLESDIRVLSLMPINRKLRYGYIIKHAILALFSSLMWMEWMKIVREKHSTFLKLYYALRYYISSEMFYNQLRHVVNLDGALVYTYWNTSRTLGVCRHKHEHKGLKIITRVHGIDLYNERGLGGRQYFRWLVNRELDAIFFVSQNGLSYYRDTFQVDYTPKMFFAPLGISEMPVSRAPRENDDFVLVSCSNVIPLKRVDLIVKALAEVRSKRKIRWIHFGDGSDMPYIKELASELLTCRENISYELQGHEDNNKIRYYYASHAIGGFISTSSTEGGPVSIQEALCAAIPIIGTNVGGIPEMIDGNGILLSENPSVDEVVASIECLVGLSVGESAVMRRRSREIWQDRYMAEKNFQRFVCVLGEIVRE